jgi:predicted aspartyl protease
VPVEWLVDTGAEISTVRNHVGRDLGGEPTALTAGGTTGGGGIQVFRGLSAKFDVKGAGGARTVEIEGYVGVKRGDTGSNLLGMHHLALIGATVSWDPARGAGTVRDR